MEAFIAPTIGGLLIGSSAVLLLALLGRIAGISSIVWGAISGQADNSWRWLFILGLLAGPLLYHAISSTPYPAPSAQPSGTQTALTFQGAPELALSGGQPDVANSSDWEDKLTNVSGYRFVRFKSVMKGNGQTKQVPTIDELIIPFIFFTVN